MKKCFQKKISSVLNVKFPRFQTEDRKDYQRIACVNFSVAFPINPVQFFAIDLRIGYKGFDEIKQISLLQFAAAG